jgi:hypothetical protein
MELFKLMPLPLIPEEPMDVENLFWRATCIANKILLPDGHPAIEIPLNIIVCCWCSVDCTWCSSIDGEAARAVLFAAVVSGGAWLLLLQHGLQFTASGRAVLGP